MRTGWMITLTVSSILLGFLFLKSKLPTGWFTRFATHLVVSAMAIYALNFSGWVTGLYIPLNPVTIGTAALLGLPGIALVAGLQWMLLA